MQELNLTLHEVNKAITTPTWRFGTACNHEEPAARLASEKKSTSAKKKAEQKKSGASKKNKKQKSKQKPKVTVTSDDEDDDKRGIGRFTYKQIRSYAVVWNKTQKSKINSLDSNWPKTLRYHILNYRQQTLY